MGGETIGDWRAQEEMKVGDCFPVMEEKRVFRMSMTSRDTSAEDGDWNATSSSLGFAGSSMIRLT